MIHPQSEAQSALERPHVLIVSDDEDLSAFLGLVYGGFWTSTVASGIQTLEVSACARSTSFSWIHRSAT